MHHALAAARRNVDLIPDRPFDRIHICGKPGSDDARIEYKTDPVTGRVLSAWQRGFLECGLVWVCSFCGAREGWRQEAMLLKGIEGYRTLGSGDGAMFMTLTATHAEWRSLEEMLHAVTKGFTALMNSRLMKGLVKDGTIFGWVRALEVTYGLKLGSKGWHPHVHVLLFVRDADAFMAAWNRQGTGIPYEWVRSLNTVSTAAGYKMVGCHPRRQDVRPADLGDASTLSGYMTKGRSRWDIAREVTRGDLKSVAETSVTPQEMLLRSGQDPRMAQLWTEYALATRRMQAVTQSRKMVDDSRVPILDHLAGLSDRHDARQARQEELKARRDFEAQRPAWESLSDEVRDEYLARDEKMVAAELERQPTVSTALYVSPGALAQRQTRTKRWDSRDIQAMLDAVRQGGPSAGKEVALRLDLPFSLRRRGRIVGAEKERRAGWRDYLAARAIFEETKRAELDAALREECPQHGIERLGEQLEDRLIDELKQFDAERKPFGQSLVARARVQAEYEEDLRALQSRLAGQVPPLAPEEIASRLARFVAMRDPSASLEESMHGYEDGLFDRGLPSFLDDGE